MPSKDSKDTVPPKASRKKKTDVEESKEEEVLPKGKRSVDPAGSKRKAGAYCVSNLNQTQDMEANETSSEENGNQGDEKSKKKKKNSDFVDMEKTGRWGAVSKTEIIAVTIVMVLIAAAVAITLVMVLGDEDKDGNNNNAGAAEKLSPILTPDEQMELIRSTLDANPLTSEVWSEVGEGGSQNPYRFAANWIVEVDKFDREADILPRFALATLYAATIGNEWTNNQGWLDGISVCDGWFGVSCDGDGNVVEIDLSDNMLRGGFPTGPLILLPTLESVRVDNNVLKGPLNSEFFGHMPNLQFLYLQRNKFEGEIPETFLANGKLRTVFLQYNLFQGEFPALYCPKCEDCEHPLESFAIDCEEVSCPEHCCNPELNCFTY